MKWFFRLVGIAVVIAGFGVMFFAPAAWLRQPAKDAPTITVDVRDGWTVRDVSRALGGVKLVSPFAYRLYSWIDSAAMRPRAGTYVIPKGSNYRSIARMIALGPARNEMSFTVIEGWTISDILKALEKEGIKMAPSDFFAERFSSNYSFFKTLSSGTTMEGYLFPDTYRVWKDQMPDALIMKQLDEFASKTKGFEEEAAKQGRSFRDVVILASIIEKEVRNDEDRATVAGIFMNRLEKGMRLQSDATLNYVIKSGRSRLNSDDVASDSPYNTYQYAGLPPGPISNPGFASLEAALHPAKTPYWYFLTDDQGKTYFGKTLEEHVRNRYKAFGE